MPTQFFAPLTVRRNAEKALARREELPYHLKGLHSAGLARAKQLAANKPLSVEDLKQMRAWFARHYATSRLSPNYSRRERAWVAWNAWGGTDGRKWVEEMLKSLKK